MVSIFFFNGVTVKTENIAAVLVIVVNLLLLLLLLCVCAVVFFFHIGWKLMVSQSH